VWGIMFSSANSLGMVNDFFSDEEVNASREGTLNWNKKQKFLWLSRAASDNDGMFDGTR